jgi:hypothetical protein
MDYFAGLDISMNETHVCVVDRDGEVTCEIKTASTTQTRGSPAGLTLQELKGR